MAVVDQINEQEMNQLKKKHEETVQQLQKKDEKIKQQIGNIDFLNQK